MADVGQRTDRYEAAGLRRNPFAAPGHNDVLGDAFADRGLPEPRRSSRTLVQLIGVAGAGKTSQLRHWQEHLPGPYHWIPRKPYRSRWAAPPKPHDGIVYGDEIDRMPAPLRTAWFRRCAAAGATVVVGTHADLSTSARHAGLGVRTHHLGPADHALLTTVIQRRIDSVALDGPVAPFVTAQLVDKILLASAGNLRTADVECHRRLAEHVAHR